MTKRRQKAESKSIRAKRHSDGLEQIFEKKISHNKSKEPDNRADWKEYAERKRSLRVEHSKIRRKPDHKKRERLFFMQNFGNKKADEKRVPGQKKGF